MNELDPDRWYFTKERLFDSPSRVHGLDMDEELACRQHAANLIQNMGQKLELNQLCINTAIVYMHRFYVFHSLLQFHCNNIAMASIFLAAKVEEQIREVAFVVQVADVCIFRGDSSLDPSSEYFQQLTTDLICNETVLLQTLGFELSIDHPHTHIVKCCQLVKASKDLAQTSYFMASNSLHLTTMCLQYKPTVVACFCIHLACKWSNWEIPQSNEGRAWFWYVDKTVTLDLLEQLTSEFLVIVEKCPTKLKNKMMSMKQHNLPLSIAPSAGQDEPRRLVEEEADSPPEDFLQDFVGIDESSGNNNGGNTPQQHKQEEQQYQQPPPHQHPIRHNDHKKYKEKMERERLKRDNMQRENYNDSKNNAGSQQGHIISKPLHKIQHQQPQGRSSSSSVHKQYPQQRSHGMNMSDTHQKDTSQQRSPSIKGSSKKKYYYIKESVSQQRDFGQHKLHSDRTKKYSRNSKDLHRSKSARRYSTQQVTTNFPGQATESHQPPKGQTIPGIRDKIPQSSSVRDKAHRESSSRQQRPYQNYPYPRSGRDKYGLSSRPTVIASTKTIRDESSRTQDESLLEPRKKLSVKTAHHQSSYVDRYNDSLAHQQKLRDTKYKGHTDPPKDSSLKNVGSSPHQRSVFAHSSMSTKKSAVKRLDKNRKYNELGSSTDSSLLSPDCLLVFKGSHLAKTLEPERTTHQLETQKKEAISTNMHHKPCKIKSSTASKNHEINHQLPSLLDFSDSELSDLPCLIDTIEPPARLGQYENRKSKSLLVGDMSKSGKIPSIFSPDGIISPKITFSLFDDEIRYSEIHFSSSSSAVKKSYSSSSSLPSVPMMTSHHSDSSGSSERALIIPTTSLASFKSGKVKKPEKEDVKISISREKRAESMAKRKNYVPIEDIPNTVNFRSPIRMMPLDLSEAGVIAFSSIEKTEAVHDFPSIDHEASNTICTVNWTGEEKMICANTTTEKPPVIMNLSTKKPTPELIELGSNDVPVILSPLCQTPARVPREMKKETKSESSKHGNSNSLRKEKKRKGKDKDRERHKEEKRSNGRKEKKKHRDKDKKSHSHRNRDRHIEKIRDVRHSSAEHHLLASESMSSGLKIKISKELVKRDYPESIKSSAPEGGLKIKIRKDIVYTVEEMSSERNEKESSSYGFYHKSSEPCDKKSSISETE